MATVIAMATWVTIKILLHNHKLPCLLCWGDPVPGRVVWTQQQVCRLPFLSTVVYMVHYIDDIMLLGPSEQEIKAAPHLLVRHGCQCMGSKSDKSSWTFDLSEYTRGPVSGACQDISLSWHKYCIWPLLQPKKCNAQWVLKAIHSSFRECYSDPFTDDPKGFYFWGQPRAREGSATDPAWSVRHLTIWPSRPNRAWGLSADRNPV